VGPDGERNGLSLTSFVREGRALSELAFLIRTFARRHKNIQFVSIASRRKCEEPRLSCPPRDKQTATSMTGALFLIAIELKISRAVTEWISTSWPRFGLVQAGIRSCVWLRISIYDRRRDGRVMRSIERMDARPWLASCYSSGS
jgi:hypothetical protein